MDIQRRKTIAVFTVTRGVFPWTYVGFSGEKRHRHHREADFERYATSYIDPGGQRVDIVSLRSEPARFPWISQEDLGQEYPLQPLIFSPDDETNYIHIWLTYLHSMSGYSSLSPGSFAFRMDIDVDLGDLVDLEQRFYDEGFKDATQHGRLHGLIEGRALGKEKGFEMWEEVGFYLGFATAWKALLQMQSDPNSKVLSHLTHLLELVGSFPMRNPSRGLEDMKDASGVQEVDISGLLSRMRARYRVICSGLGVRPRLPSSNVMNASLSQEEGPSYHAEFTSDDVNHSSQTSNPSVWSFADASKNAGVGGMAF